MQKSVFKVKEWMRDRYKYGTVSKTNLLIYIIKLERKIITKNYNKRKIITTDKIMKNWNK